MNRDKLIEIGLELEHIAEYNELCEQFEEWRSDVLRYIETTGGDSHSCRVLLHIVDTPFGAEEIKKEAYISSIRKTIKYLEELDVKKECVNPLEVMINNFGLYLQNMYDVVPENKATLQKNLLEQIVINNEYDLQHIMYAMVKTLYPSARREVNQDMGYGTVRFDIIIEEIDTVIELKCTRKDHSDKSLCRELGEDGYFYKCAHLIIYIYDKERIVSDVTNFIRALERTKENAGKEVRVFVEQNKNLI